MQLDARIAQMAAAHAGMDRSRPLHVGLSACALEMVYRYVRPDSGLDGLYAHERRQALSEAAARHAAVFDEDVAIFELPATRVHGPGFVSDFRKALKGSGVRVPKREMLHAFILALRVARLPDDPWLYVEPQFHRYGPQFGFETKGLLGRAAKIVAHETIKVLARGAPFPR